MRLGRDVALAPWPAAAAGHLLTRPQPQANVSRPHRRPQDEAPPAENCMELEFETDDEARPPNLSDSQPPCMCVYCCPSLFFASLPSRSSVSVSVSVSVVSVSLRLRLSLFLALSSSARQYVCA